MKRTTLALSFLALLFAGACKDKESPAQTEPAPSHAEVPVPAVKKKMHEMPKVQASTKFLAPTESGKVFFVAPAEGATIKGPLVDGKVAIKIEMGIDGLKVEPAGSPQLNAGHHHVIVDGKLIASETIVPMDETHLHFGKGQTETTIHLKPGSHSLGLQFADGLHRSYGKSWHTQIKITVVAE